MKVSFIIPAYNEEWYIGDCIRSIQAEIKSCSYECELIVVNNASTDRTKEIALAFDGVKVIDEPQKGLVKARQAGHRAATGDLEAHIDADSRIREDWLKEVMEVFKTDEKVVCVSGPCVYYDLPKSINMLAKGYYASMVAGNALGELMNGYGAGVQGGNFVVKKKAISDVGSFDTSIDFYGEDTDIARRLSQVGKIYFSRKLWVYSSGRRLKNEGVFNTTFRYALNYFWIHCFKRPYHTTSTDVRPQR